MDNILVQSFSYAEICLLKNYSNINDKPNFSLVAKSIDKSYGYSNIIPSVFESSPHSIYKLRLAPKGKGKFFTYDKDDDPSMVLLKPFLFTQSNDSLKSYIFQTSKVKHIKKHYGNPFASIHIHRIERTIRKDGNKIIIKLYIGNRKRNLNNIYFQKSSQSVTITIDLTTGNFLIVDYKKVRRSEHKRFYSNSFLGLKNAISQIFTIEKLVYKTSVMRNDYLAELDNQLFHYVLFSQFNFSFNYAVRLNKELSFDFANAFINQWAPIFIHLRKIKAPDDGNRLIQYFYPTEKYLKKNDRKLVAAVLDRFGIKSNVTIKILHEIPNLNMIVLVKTCYLFGKDFRKYIGNIPKYFFSIPTREIDSDMFAKSILNDERESGFIEVSESDKENIFRIICDYILCYDKTMFSDSHSILELLFDHFKMIERVKEYYPDYKLTARTYKSFHEDHVFLSGIERKIERGWTLQRVYDENVIREIEKPIDAFTQDKIDISQFGYDVENILKLPISGKIERFIPKVLTTTEEYNDEGFYMHHCVSGYISSEHSFIVSLRYGDERITCEFDTTSRRCKQARYFKNDPIPSHFELPLETLKERINNVPFSIRLKEQIRIPLVINGKVVKIEEKQNDMVNFF